MSRNGDLVDQKAWADLPLLTGVIDPAGGKINLSWTTPPTAYSGFSGYQIFRSDNGGAFTLLASVNTSTYTYQDAALVTGHTYVYYVAPTWLNGFQLATNRVSIAGSITDTFSLSSGTWTKRPSLHHVIATLIGGGGGGAGGGGGPAPSRAGGGAAGGGYWQGTFAAALLSATESVTLGLGGLGGASVVSGNGGVGGNPGGTGGSTSFGAHATANGGGGGLQYTGSGPGGSAGGTTSSSGATSVTSESGGNGYKEQATPPGNTTFAGAGGGQPDLQAGGTAANNGTGNFGGNGGQGGQGVMNAPGVAGQNGAAYGGGGGGGGAAGTGLVSGGPLSGKGGDGAPGLAVITSYFW